MKLRHLSTGCCHRLLSSRSCFVWFCRSASTARKTPGAYSDQLYSPIVEAGVLGVKTLVTPPPNYTDNQLILTGNETRLRSLIDNFKAPIAHTFGYGSGVFKQAGYSTGATAPQIDMIHIVRDLRKFHGINLTQYPHHYSFLKNWGLDFLTKVNKWGAGVYFNPYVSMTSGDGTETMIKYGVTDLKDVLTDLSEWSTLYLAGRLQKPVNFFNREQESHFNMLNQYNLQNACLVAILMLSKSQFSELQLYEKIAQISYMGDIRMLIGGENPNKVKNIISKNYHHFRQLYEPVIQHVIAQKYIVLSEGPKGEMSPRDRKHYQDLPLEQIRHFDKEILGAAQISRILAQLPLHFRRKLFAEYSSKLSDEFQRDEQAQQFVQGHSARGPRSTSGFVAAIAHDPQLKDKIKKTIKHTVAYAALTQTVKGIFTAGLIKSVKYAWEKKLKSFKKN